MLSAWLMLIDSIDLIDWLILHVLDIFILYTSGLLQIYSCYRRDGCQEQNTAFITDWSPYLAVSKTVSMTSRGNNCLLAGPYVMSWHGRSLACFYDESLGNSWITQNGAKEIGYPDHDVPASVGCFFLSLLRTGMVSLSLSY